MYTNSTLKPIDDNALYVGLDGTQWANTDKATIPELHKVIECPRPPEEDYIITGFHIDESYHQQWDCTLRPVPTLEEAQAEYKAAAKNTYVAWFKRNSDDYYICKARTGAEVPQDVIDAGLDLDSRYTEYKADVDNCNNIAELKVLGEFNV